MDWADRGVQAVRYSDPRNGWSCFWEGFAYYCFGTSDGVVIVVIFLGFEVIVNGGFVNIEARMLLTFLVLGLLSVFQIARIFHTTSIPQAQEVGIMLSIRNIAALVVALAQFDAAQAQAAGYAQCKFLLLVLSKHHLTIIGGGVQWTGATTCVSGWTCTYSK